MKLQEAFEKLGSTTEQVVATLDSMHIKGRPRKTCACPIAIYLQRQCGDRGISVGLSHAGNDDLGEQIEMPEHVRNFIVNFDDGAYPELETP